MFKEAIHSFERIQCQQTLIYEGLGKYGYPFEKDDPPYIISNLISSVQELKKLDSETDRHSPKLVRSRNVHPNGVTVIIRIIHETDGCRYIGTEYNISFNRINTKSPINLHKYCDAFITVNSKTFTEKLKS